MIREWRRHRTQKGYSPRAHLFIDGQALCRNAGKGGTPSDPAEMNEATGLPNGRYCFTCRRWDELGRAVACILRNNTDRRKLWIRALDSQRPASLPPALRSAS